MANVEVQRAAVEDDRIRLPGFGRIERTDLNFGVLTDVDFRGILEAQNGRRVGLRYRVRVIGEVQPSEDRLELRGGVFLVADDAFDARKLLVARVR